MTGTIQLRQEKDGRVRGTVTIGRHVLRRGLDQTTNDFLDVANAKLTGLVEMAVRQGADTLSRLAAELNSAELVVGRHRLTVYTSF